MLFIRILFAWLVVVGSILPAVAQLTPPPADTPANGGAWYDGAGGGGPFSSPDAACRHQFERFASEGVYEGAERTSLQFAKCHWRRALINPTIVQLYCPEGSVFSLSLTCARRVDVVPECPTCQKGDAQSSVPGPRFGKPIEIATGAEAESETDYTAANGLFAVTRFYRSRQRGRSSSADHEMPGFGWAWHGVIPARLIVSGANEEIAEYHSDTGGIDFYQAPASDTSSFSYVEQGISRRRLSMVGAPGANRIDYFRNAASVSNGPGEMRLDFSNGEYILFRRADTYRFTADIRYLVPVEHGFASGYKQWLDYPDKGEYPNRLRDSLGRSIAIGWQGAFEGGNIDYRVISQLTLPDGTVLAYTYDRNLPPQGASGGEFYAGNPQDRLLSATRRDGNNAVRWSHSYVYEDPRFGYAMTGIIDQNGKRLATIGYSDAGLATSTQRAGGFDKHVIEYLQDAPSQPLQNYVRNVTGPLGQVETYTFLRSESALAGMQPVLTRVDRAASATVPAASRVYNFTNTNGMDNLLSGEQDFRGARSSMVLDTANRRPIAATEAQGSDVERTISTTWHAQFDLPTKEVRQGLTVDYGYNATGQLISRTETDTTSQTVPYSTAGQARTTTYEWDPANGHLLRVNGPLPVDTSGKDDTVTYDYANGPNLRSMTNGLGHVTAYSAYDANGRVGQIVDPNGIKTLIAYNALGRVKMITVKDPAATSLDAITTIDYDVEGRVTGITLPATEKLFFDYNLAGLMTSMRAANGERIDYSYDAMRNVTSETTRRADATTARLTTRTFDSIGRVLSEVTGNQRIRRWSYDANDNPTTVTDPNANATTQAFDALGRLMTVVAPDGGTTALAYDQKDGIVKNTDPGQVATLFVRNGFGEIIREISPDRGTSIYWYDAAGQMIKSQDGRGQPVTYTRDILGRLTQKVAIGRSASSTVTYEWDTAGLPGSYGVGRLATITDTSGVTRFKYDHRGNMLVQQQTVGASTAAELVYAYDLGDRVTQITYPSGRIVQYGRDTKGRVNTVLTKASALVASFTTLASGLTYEPFGAMKAMTLGNTLSVANDWGNDGRLASRRLYRTSGGTNLSLLTYEYDANDNLISVADQINSANSARYGYDGNDRLVVAALSAGTATTGTDTYAYTAGTNRLASITNAAGTRTLGYDGRGNLANESRPGSITATTVYDGHARLVNYARSDIGTLTLTYNGRDDRVTMRKSGITRWFVYDADGRVLGEYGASAANVRAEFIWALPEVGNDNTPFGGDDGAGGYMPLAVATPDTGGTVVVNWVHGNHLGVPLVTTDATGVAASTPNDYFVPGYPGQSRVVGDLYYNRYRDYDPGTGRYIQADPIGLEGGQNPYAYAGNNPMRWTDPTGTCPMCLVIPLIGCSGGGCEALGILGLGAL